MTEEQFKNLKVGDEIYSFYLPSKKNCKNKVVGRIGYSILLEGEMYSKDLSQCANYFFTEEEAKREYVKYFLESYNDGLKKAQEKVSAYLNNIDKLKSNYGTDFPELFI